MHKKPKILRNPSNCKPLCSIPIVLCIPIQMAPNTPNKMAINSRSMNAIINLFPFFSIAFIIIIHNFCCKKNKIIITKMKRRVPPFAQHRKLLDGLHKRRRHKWLRPYGYLTDNVSHFGYIVHYGSAIECEAPSNVA